MLSFLTRVEIRPKLVCRLFGAKSWRGYVSFGEIGKYSKQRLYTVVCEDGKVA